LAPIIASQRSRIKEGVLASNQYLQREASETKYWLRMMACAVPSRKDDIRPLWKETHELNLIFASIFRKSRLKD